MGKVVRRSLAGVEASVSIIGESTHLRSNNSSTYPNRQLISRKKANPVSAYGNRFELAADASVAGSVGSVATPPDYLTYAPKPELDAFPHGVPSIPYPIIDPALLNNIPNYTNSAQIDSSIVKYDAHLSTPKKKRVHSDGDSQEINPKRKRELKNEKNAREKKTAAEDMLSYNRAALPRSYREFVETQVHERFGPRTTEVAGGNNALDSKMYIADVMARSAISIKHLELILKHKGSNIVQEVLAMEDAEKAMKGLQVSAPESYQPPHFLEPSSSSSGLGVEEMSQDLSFLLQWQSPLTFNYLDFENLALDSDM